MPRALRLAAWLLVPLAAAAAAAVGWAAGPQVGHSTKLFPLAVLGLAGGISMITAIFLVDPAWILSIGLGLSIFSGNWAYVHSPVPLDRVVIFAGLLAVLARLVTDPAYPRIRLRPLHWLMALLIVYALASAAVAGTLSQHQALFELIDRLGALPFLLYLVAPTAFATEYQRNILLVTLVVIGGYLGLTAIFEMAGPKALVFPSYINNSLLGIHYGRARGPFLEAAADGLAMFCCAVAGVMLLGRVRDRWGIWAIRAVIALCSVGVVLSLTREVWLGSIVAAVVPAALSPRLRRYVPIGLGAAALSLAVLLLAVPALGSALSSRANDQQPVWDRLNSDAAALRMIEARPAVGFGWGTFPIASPSYYHVAGSYPLSAVTEVHNVVLSNGVELGVLGLALWLSILVSAVVLPWRRGSPASLHDWRLAMTAIVVAWFVQANFTPLAYAFVNYLPWLFAALATASAPVRGAAPRPALVPA